ncbi:MAG: TlyA family RNA methyltransferase [Rhodoferax sp.]
MRIDQLLVQRGLAQTRSQAQRLIASGVQWQSPDGRWHTAHKSGDAAALDAPLRLLDAAEARYVSRGGLKLEAALAHCGLDVTGWRCLDVGQSTGGFTDCLLQHGAASVLGVDVGHDQLHPRLRDDPRVCALQSVNARHLDATTLIAATADQTGGGGHFFIQINDPETERPAFDLIVADLSFISQTLVLPALVPLLAPQGWLITLVKPQFELQPQHIGKGGLVKDPALYHAVRQRLEAACATLNLQLRHWLDSPIAGGDGNREFFMAAQPGCA